MKNLTKNFLILETKIILTNKNFILKWHLKINWKLQFRKCNVTLFDRLKNYLKYNRLMLISLSVDWESESENSNLKMWTINLLKKLLCLNICFIFLNNFFILNYWDIYVKHIPNLYTTDNLSVCLYSLKK